jgi:hypothetical protein
MLLDLDLSELHFPTHKQISDYTRIPELERTTKYPE